MNAARSLEIEAKLIDYRSAFGRSSVLRAIAWRLLDHRPIHFARFNAALHTEIERFAPTLVLATGFAPIEGRLLAELEERGTTTVVYLTDDPWNEAHRAPWFMRDLPKYQQVYTTRTANLEQLQEVGCREVSFLQFAYAPEVHFVEDPGPAEAQLLGADVSFIGAADRDRLVLAEALIRSGLKVGLYGRYWDSHRTTRPYARGVADTETARKATRAAKLTLGLVRRANRDGSSMRTFEVPAMGGCPLFEWTAEHETMFGSEEGGVSYFRSIEEMVSNARTLIQDPDSRRKLADLTRQVIVEGGNTYADRLRKIQLNAARDEVS